MLSDFNQIINVVVVLTLIAVVVSFIIISVVLNYHWSRYGISADKIKRVKRIYFGISAVFIAIMAVSFIIFLYGRSF
ncbi:MAG: hypothetical protein DDT19_02439 [Syntrophomonadaceae bacterium]|nr:hypothetical protein [Bacillota bacterium]